MTFQYAWFRFSDDRIDVRQMFHSRSVLDEPSFDFRSFVSLILNDEALRTEEVNE